MAYSSVMPANDSNPYAQYSNTIAPAALGCALGLLFGRGMSRTSANLAALALLATGAVIAAPTVVDLIQAAANRPGSERGSRKRLQGIRDSGLPDKEVEGFYVDDLPLSSRS